MSESTEIAVTEAKSVGRPTKYKPEFAEQAYNYCLLGAKNTQLAEFFKVSESTLDKWMHEHEEFSGSVRQGREIADSEVALSMYQAAKGFEHKAIQFMNVKGEVQQHEYTKKYPPDMKAVALWLKNRQPELWRDKREVEVKHEGELKQVNVNMTYEEAARIFQDNLNGNG